MASSLASLFVQAFSHGGRFRTGQPRVIVIHSIECPLERGRAVSLARGWFASPQAGTSVHYIVDPGQTVRCLDEGTIGWGAGTVNSCAIHIEQTGYAQFSRAQWTTPDGLAQLDRLAALVRDICARLGIPRRWLSDADLRAAHAGTGQGGLVTHDDCRRALGGTTHTDPGPSYPRDLLIRAVQGTGVEAPRAEDDMPYTEAQLRAIYRSEFLATLRSDEGREAVAIALLGYPRKRPDFWQMLNDIWHATTKGKP